MTIVEVTAGLMFLITDEQELDLWKNYSPGKGCVSLFF